MKKINTNIIPECDRGKLNEAFKFLSFDNQEVTVVTSIGVVTVKAEGFYDGTTPPSPMIIGYYL